MRYDAPSTPMRQLNRKWAWDVKIEVFRPWTLQFLEIFYLFFHTGLEHYALRFSINADATTKPEVSGDRQNGGFPSLDFTISRKKLFHTGLEHHVLRCTIDADATTKPEVPWSVKKASKCSFFVSELQKM